MGWSPFSVDHILRNWIRIWGMEQTQEVFNLVANSSLFHDLEVEDIEEILKVAHTSKLNEDEFFFIEDSPANLTYLLIKGKVKLNQVTLDGKQIILGYLIPGRVYGIIAMLKKVTYPVSAQAVGECTALVWDQKALNIMMDQYPRIALNSLRIMSGQIRNFQNSVRDLSTKRVETRIARTVLHLANQSGRKVDGGILIDLPLTRQDLAEMTGTTLYTVSRVLTGWEKQNIVHSERQQIIIIYPHGLVSIAEDLPSTQKRNIPKDKDICDIGGYSKHSDS